MEYSSKTNLELQNDAAGLIVTVSALNTAKIAKTDFVIVDSSITWTAPDGSTYTFTTVVNA
jgi:hypothetical protein